MRQLYPVPFHLIQDLIFFFLISPSTNGLKKNLMCPFCFGKWFCQSFNSQLAGVKNACSSPPPPLPAEAGKLICCRMLGEHLLSQTD